VLVENGQGWFNVPSGRRVANKVMEKKSFPASTTFVETKFRQEYINMVTEAGIEFDEQYLAIQFDFHFVIMIRHDIW
jgi:hypothetical protein